MGIIMEISHTKIELEIPYDQYIPLMGIFPNDLKCTTEIQVY